MQDPERPAAQASVRRVASLTGRRCLFGRRRQDGPKESPTLRRVVPLPSMERHRCLSPGLTGATRPAIRYIERLGDHGAVTSIETRAAQMTMPWLRLNGSCTRPSSSPGADRGAPAITSSWPPWRGSAGATPTSPQRLQRHPSRRVENPTRLSRPRSPQLEPNARILHRIQPDSRARARVDSKETARIPGPATMADDRAVLHT